MDQTTVIILVVGGLALLIVAAFAAAFVYRISGERRTRRVLVQLISRKEAILAGCLALRRLVEHLAECPDEELAGFDVEPQCEDRRAFGDVAMSMRIVDEEIQHMEVPKALQDIAVEMEEVAKAVGSAAGKAEAPDGGDALDAVAQMDLQGITERAAAMNRNLGEIAVAHDVVDPSVYGGGLYI